MQPPSTSSTAVRDALTEALELDLIGPWAGNVYASELLEIAPSRWYLTGFLVPFEAKAEQRCDETAQEQLELELQQTSGSDDDERPERGSARKAFWPSSIGASVLVSLEVRELLVTATWGDYEPLVQEEGGPERWQRRPRSEELRVLLPVALEKPASYEVPSSRGLHVVVAAREVGSSSSNAAVLGLAAGTRVASVFLVNHRQPAEDERKDCAFVFQAGLLLRCEQPFVPRPNVRGLSVQDPDERVADLQYRDAFELSVGHGVSTHAIRDAAGACREVRTSWMPTAEVERVEPAPAPGVELGMEALGAAADAEALRSKLDGMTQAYGAWIEAQRKGLPEEPARREVAEDLLRRAALARDRIREGLEALGDPDVLEAFRIANRAMAAAARRRQAQLRRCAPEQVDPPKWRPFQLAFLLVNLRGLADPAHGDRERVDLLFFPTGGGKTEAYLGLAAFALVLRRLRRPGLSSAGMAVLMRYTLRLLTLDQLSRAATLLCALELERANDASKLGSWPFEIGLWVGLGATPNRMGRKGDNDRHSARARTIAFKNDTRRPLPIPLDGCPWCGEKFGRDSFSLLPNADHPLELRIVCTNRRCEFTGKRPLPIVAVDDSIYRRLPCFVIATVDKFASLPWVGQSGALLGGADRHDAAGFYGPSEPHGGSKLGEPLLPPDLIIQDELHLVSGPLGTMAGLYETAIDALCTRRVAERTLRPKIVASTATVRRADAQIRALFGRASVEVFPPPGPDRRDSFFGKTVPASVIPARRYVGIAAPGRSLKVVLLRTLLALLGAAQRAFLEAKKAGLDPNPADPYMSALGYFNSLRELGGSRRIVEDEVTSRLRSYGRRRRVGEAEGLFADRAIAYDVVELTSRESTSKVAEAKRRLALPFPSKECVDVALATNMISVGLDISRLGLMLILGQPKSTAEYIQASSRVGRDETWPGLIVTLLNVHRPRDRSHYERFESYHATFYRGVEATSVTPFSPRAVDRGIAASIVALARHGHRSLAPATGALEILPNRAQLGFVVEAFARRAAEHNIDLPHEEREELRQRMTARVNDLLDSWVRVADQSREAGSGLQYGREEGVAKPLLFDPLDPELASQTQDARKFRAQRSLRDVEPSVDLWVRRLDGVEVEAPAEDS